MDNQQEQNERNSLKILFLAAEQYLKNQDELGRNFIQPQIHAAGEILNSVLNQRWPSTEQPVADSVVEEV
jgi:hypothetical protein